MSELRPPLTDQQAADEIYDWAAKALASEVGYEDHGEIGIYWHHTADAARDVLRILNRRTWIKLEGSAADPLQALTEATPDAGGVVQHPPLALVSDSPIPEQFIPLDKIAPKTKPKPAPKKSAKSTKVRVTAPKPTDVNDTIRTALAAGGNIATAAELAGVSVRSAKQRATWHSLWPKKTSAVNPPTTAATPTPAPSQPTPRPGPSNPPSGTAKATHRMVPVLGARRRIMSLYAIGWDLVMLADRMRTYPGLISKVLDDETTEITPVEHDLIDGLWKRLRYQTTIPRENVIVDRTWPPPGKWDNIDNPKETH